MCVRERERERERGEEEEREKLSVRKCKLRSEPKWLRFTVPGVLTLVYVW